MILDFDRLYEAEYELAVSKLNEVGELHLAAAFGYLGLRSFPENDNIRLALARNAELRKAPFEALSLLEANCERGTTRGLQLLREASLTLARGCIADFERAAQGGQGR